MHRARFIISRHDQEVQRIVVVMYKGAMDALHYELTVVRLAVRAKVVFVHVTIATISPAYKNIVHAALQFCPHLSSSLQSSHYSLFQAVCLEI